MIQTAHQRGCVVPYCVTGFYYRTRQLNVTRVQFAENTMPVGNDTTLSFIMMVRETEEKFFELDDLLSASLEGWRTISNESYMADEPERKSLRRPNYKEKGQITQTMAKYCVVSGL